MEHTGIYCNPLLSFAESGKLSVWVEHAGRIKAFHGLQREKNDRLDALRIAQYAQAKKHMATTWEPPRGAVVRLKSLLRLRLVDAKQRLVAPLAEEKRFGDRQWALEQEKIMRRLIKGIEEQIRNVELAIKELLRGDGRLGELFERVSSVKGVGLIVASNTIVITNELKKISDPRKMDVPLRCGPIQADIGEIVAGQVQSPP